MNIGLLSFNSGELSPLVDARSDVEKYGSGCRTLENMLPRIYGGVERRPGLQYIYKAKLSPQGIRLIPFIYSSTIAYMCEFGDLYARFYYDGAILLDGSDDPVEVVTPYLVADLPRLQYKQIGDVMYLVHPDYAPYKLSRTSATEFSIDEIEFEKGPFLLRNDLDEVNGVTDLTMTSSVTAVDAVGTLTASAAFFDDDQVGALFKLTHPRVNTRTYREWTGSDTTDDCTPLDVKGAFSFNTHGTWIAEVQLLRNENSAGWEVYRSWIGKNDTNIQYTGTEKADNVQYKVKLLTHTSGTITAEVVVHNYSQDGIVKITAINTTTVAAIEVISELASTDATKRWAEGVWSTYRDFPGAITLHEGRVVYGGMSRSLPNVWLSATEDYENFEEGVNANDSFAFALESTNEIRWIESLDSLCVGTSEDEWIIQSNKIDTPLTPNPANLVKTHTNYGSCRLQPVVSNNSILFVDYVRRKVRELVYPTEVKYCPDMTALAEHITETGITSIAYQKNPDSILWAVRDDGTLLSMTYEREQNVVAWARHICNPSLLDTSETDWAGSDVSAYERTMISENGIIWGIPINFYTQTTVTLDADGVARDVGGGIVGIPCTKHSFKEGQSIRISGTTSYSAQYYTLTSGTTVDELQFASGHTDETFDGTETVIQYINVSSGIGAMDQDSDGNLYYGYTAGLAKISSDGTVIDTGYFSPVGGWTAGKVVMGVKVSSDNLYLYVYVGDAKELFKFTLSDGMQVWKVSTGTIYGYDIDLDEDDNVYIGYSGTGGNLAKFAAADGAKTSFTDCIGVYSTVVDDDMGIVITASKGQGPVAASLYNIAVRTLDDSDGTKIALGGTYFNVQYYTYEIERNCVVTLNNYIYVLVSDGNLYKLDSDLNIITQVAAPSDAQGLFIDFLGRIVLVNQHYGAPAVTDVFYFYDEDLTYMNKIDNLFTSLLGAWGASSYTKGNIGFYPGITLSSAITETSQSATGTVDSVAVMPGENEDEVWVSCLVVVNDEPQRYIARFASRTFDDIDDAFFVDLGITASNDPASTTISGLDHLIGETVTVLGDGVVYEPTAVVDANGEVTISTAVSTAQVGLPFTYKLKPMRPDIVTRDGVSHGSVVHVHEMVVSFLNTKNAQYGVNYDNLYDITWTDAQWTNNTEITGLFTGDVVVHMDGGFTIDNPLVISGSDPLPCTVRAMVPRMEKTGN